MEVFFRGGGTIPYIENLLSFHSSLLFFTPLILQDFRNWVKFFVPLSLENYFDVLGCL